RAPNEVDACWLAPNGQVGHGWTNRFQGGWSTQLGVTRPVGMLSTYHPAKIDTDVPVRGNVRGTLWEDGSFLAKGHMHGSGFDPYDFIVQASVPVDTVVDDYIALTTYRNGHVDGWEPFGDEERSYDWVDTGLDLRVHALFNTILA